MHAPWTLITTSDEIVCVNIKSWHSSLCDEQKTFVEMPSGNFFAKNDMPYQQLTVGVIFLNCVFVTRTKLY